MKFQSIRERLLASTIVGGAAFAAFAAAPAFAQTGSTAVQEVVVTGSRIPRPNLTSVSPVTSVNSEELKLEGTTNIEDLINNLPQAFAEYGAYQSNGATGTATVDLRGLGSKRTLVLIDGKRIQPGDPGLPVADLNFIPSSLVDRVEILTGGASSVYGSDALAGVVNFIMKKNYEGLHIDVQYDFAWHNNDNSYMQGLLAQKPTFADPKGERVDGRRTVVTIAGGANSSDGKGNTEFYFTYSHSDAVKEDSRDFTACALSTTGAVNSYRICGGSSTSYPGKFTPLSKGVPGAATAYEYNSSGTLVAATINPLYAKNLTVGAGSTFIPYSPATNPYNFAPSNYLQRPDERYTAGNYSHYQINKAIDVYSSFMFMDDHTVAQIAPSGIFYGSAVTLNCNNPLLSTQQKNALCGNPATNYASNATAVYGPGGVLLGAPVAGQYYTSTGVLQTAAADPIFGNGGNSADSTPLYIGRRNVEGGGRISDIRHTDYREVIGAKGELAPGWTYDVSAQYGTTIYVEQETGYFSKSAFTNALNATSTTTCAVGGKCVPYNIFTLGQVSNSALQYLSTSAFSDGQISEQVVHGDITGKLGQYGIQSPFAKEGVGINIGAEYRRDSEKIGFDPAFSSGDLAGLGGAPQNVSGAFDVKEAFLEVSAPLIQDKFLAKDVTVDLGYRRSDYSSSGTVESYKYGVDWKITRDVMLRGSYEKAVRAPNINELYSPVSPGLFAGQDPCSGATPSYTLVQCERTGVQAAQYGSILPCSSAQCGSEGGGNPNLKPETSDTKSFGVVFTPTFIKGFTLTVDYFNINVKGAISSVGALTALSECADTGSATYCSLIHRDPNYGTLYGNGYVSSQLANIGAYRTRGIDIEANYRTRFSDWGLGDWGSLNTNFVATYLGKLTTTQADGSSFDCSGLFGVTCGTPNPYFRSKTRVTWQTPWKASFSLQWRYIGGTLLDADSSQPALQQGYYLPIDNKTPAMSYFDVAATWQVRDHIQLRVGINNIMDKDPPVFDENNFGVASPPFGNGNTYPQVFDSLGRVVFMGLSADF